MWFIDIFVYIEIEQKRERKNAPMLGKPNEGMGLDEFLCFTVL